MQCAYCKDDLLDGATVCRSCARKQPISADERNSRILVGVVIALGAGLAIFIGVAVWMSQERQAAIDRVVASSRLCGKNDPAVVIEMQMDDMHNKGVSWHDAERTMRMLECGYLTD